MFDVVGERALRKANASIFEVSNTNAFRNGWRISIISEEHRLILHDAKSTESNQTFFLIVTSKYLWIYMKIKSTNIVARI